MPGGREEYLGQSMPSVVASESGCSYGGLPYEAGTLVGPTEPFCSPFQVWFLVANLGGVMAGAEALGRLGPVGIEPGRKCLVREVSGNLLVRVGVALSTCP